MLTNCILVLIVAYFQNVAGALSSRSRNRDNMRYHTIAAIFNNGIWFLSLKLLNDSGMSIYLLFPYTIGTVSGSLSGAKIGMAVERWLGASSDSHLKGNP